MASIGEVNQGIAQAQEKAAEALAYLMQAKDYFDDMYNAVNSVTEGSSQSDVSEVFAYINDAHSKADDVKEKIMLGQEAVETVLGNLAGSASVTVEQPVTTPAPTPKTSQPSTPERPQPQTNENEDNRRSPHPTPPQETPEAAGIDLPSAPYTGQMDTIDQQLANGVSPEDIPGYVASGSNNIVYTVEGQPNLLIKMPRLEVEGDTDDEEPPLEPDFINKEHRDPLIAGSGVRGLEQIRGYIPPTEGNLGAVVVETMPGKPVEDFNQSEEYWPTKENFLDLFDTFETAEPKGINPDFDRNNIMYDLDQGFGLIDYRLSGNVSRQMSAVEMATYVGEARGGMFDLSQLGHFPAYGQSYFAALRERYGNDVAQQVRNRIESIERDDQETYGRPAIPIPEDL